MMAKKINNFFHALRWFFSSCTASVEVLYASTHCFQQCTCAVYKQVSIDLSHSNTFLAPLSCDYIDDCIVTLRYTDNRWCFSTNNIVTTSIGMSLRVLVHTDEVRLFHMREEKYIHPHVIWYKCWCIISLTYCMTSVFSVPRSQLLLFTSTYIYVTQQYG